VISENLALEYWDTPAKAIGHRIRTFPDTPWQEIIGVVGNVRADGLNHPPPALVYLPVAAEPVTRGITYVVRSSRAGTASFLRELQQAVWSDHDRRGGIDGSCWRQLARDISSGSPRVSRSADHRPAFERVNTLAPGPRQQPVGSDSRALFPLVTRAPHRSRPRALSR
jgi:hypothetical protein